MCKLIYVRFVSNDKMAKNRFVLCGEKNKKYDTNDMQIMSLFKEQTETEPQ